MKVRGARFCLAVPTFMMLGASALGLTLFVLDLVIGVSWHYYLVEAVICLLVGVTVTVAALICFVQFRDQMDLPRRRAILFAVNSVSFILVLSVSWLILGFRLLVTDVGTAQ